MNNWGRKTSGHILSVRISHLDLTSRAPTLLFLVYIAEIGIMKFENSYHRICLWLIILGHDGAECSLVNDLVNNLASSGVRCLVLISGLNAEAGHSITTTNVSNLSLTHYDTNASLSHLSTSGEDCLYYVLIFDSVDSSLKFLNRCNYSQGCFSSLKQSLTLLITDLSDI